MNPKRFLKIGGSILVTIGGLGVIGLLGSISDMAFFHPPYWINWVHLSIGVVALSISARGSNKIQSLFTLIPTILGFTLGTAGLLQVLFGITTIPIPELGDPIEMVAHLVIGTLGLWGWLNRAR
jgi:hypothetical protein